MKTSVRRYKKRNKVKIPLLSVIMPVYNAEGYIEQAIKSVLKQTFKDFELVIMDDASTDASGKLIERYAKRYPSKIRVFSSEKRIGRTRTLTRQIGLCRGEFIARQDATDIALPDRFAVQIEYLKNNPKVVACGGQCLIIDQNGKITAEKRLPLSFEDIYKNSLKYCPAIQPAIMIAKRRLPIDFKYYDTALTFSEGLEFLFRIFKYGRVENVSEYILLQRQVNKNLSLLEAKKAEIMTVASHIHGVIAHGYKPQVSGLIYAFFNMFITLFIPKRGQAFIMKYLKQGSMLYPVSRKVLRKYSYMAMI